MEEQNLRLKRTMKAVRESFERLGVRYAVGGSVAGIAHGYTRFTMDVDVVADLRPEQVADFVADLEKAHFWVDEPMIRDAIRWKRSFNVLNEDTGVKVDVFLSQGRPWDEEMLARRKMGYLGSDPEPAFEVESAEDYVLSKLSWYRQGGGVSDRQWNDILAVLKVQSLSLDTGYMERWAPHIGVSDLLEKAFDEAGFKPLE